ncbi:MAG: phosphate ABC transporter substrate-binding/OmpA family protein [Pseudomonadota bacterium]
MSMRHYTRFGAIVSVLALFAGQTIAETVTLQTVDGNISIQGQIVAFDGETYELSSSVGTLTLPAGGVVCLGEACPEIIDEGARTAAIGIVDAPSNALLDRLFKAYADGRTFGLAQESDAGAPVLATFREEGDDEPVLELNLSSPSGREAFEALVAGDTQIVVSSAPIGDALAEELIAQGHPDLRAPGREVVVALDAAVPVVHPDNPVRDVSLPVLAQIAAGRITNWSELGGPDEPIRMVLPQPGSSAYQIVEDQILRPNRLRLDRNMELVESEAIAESIVSDDPGAVTLVSNALVSNTKPVPLRQVCGPLSLPSTFTVRAEEYPLSRRVLVYTATQQQSQRLNDFIAFAGSGAAQETFTDAGFIGQTIEAVPLSLQGTRLALALMSANAPEVSESTRALTELLMEGDRLSTTFRFEAGATEIDNKSRRDAVRVAEYLMQPENLNREILLLGFTDDVGRNDLNELLTLRQATSIRDAIVEASLGQIDPSRIDVRSFGSIAPVGCNETLAGRNSNRRVEVWLR